MLKAVEVEIKHKNAMKRREEALESIFAKKDVAKAFLIIIITSLVFEFKADNAETLICMLSRNEWPGYPWSRMNFSAYRSGCDVLFWRG